MERRWDAVGLSGEDARTHLVGDARNVDAPGPGDERMLARRGLLVRMPGQPAEHIQRRLDRLRAQRAEQIAKEDQKTACAHDQGSELLALVARNGAMHVYNGCRTCHANLENGRFHPAHNIDVTVLPVGTDLRLDNLRLIWHRASSLGTHCGLRC